MFLWTLWRGSNSDIGLDLFFEWAQEDSLLEVETFGLWLMDNDWWKDAGWELELLAKTHDICPVRSVYVALCKLGHKLQILPRMVHPGMLKVSRLIDAVEAAVAPGEPSSILHECELFAKYRGQWLKVAGLEKGEIIQATLQESSLLDADFVVEFGVYVGYTAVRLGGSLVGIRSVIGLVSLEVNPIHVCVARHVLDLGHLSSVAEVMHGQAQDALPRAGEELGQRQTAFSFMDHRGTIFHRDYDLLDKNRLFAPKARFVADNTLNPGSPVYLWGRLAHGDAATVPWALTEFLSEHEDWMAATQRT